ncbi:hypothetical protein PAECIP111802_04420 [Paenibacillus allorhizosphaerae]|uniref:GNAT family N-acetyltransferase n=1 Tax=Paenibacillus allorhizosphaerae TaxID=2849866 RepID=A0ABN7TSJ1_9BACL|nr:hypothetical protein PAECIP111802_04420 [Paenibacillus allorhizosphaerae]
MPLSDYVIREIELDELPAAIDFVMDIVREVFPMLRQPYSQHSIRKEPLRLRRLFCPTMTGSLK